MPPKFALNPTMRPLQSEITTLQKLLSGDILEHSARILEQYTAAQASNLEPGLVRPPQFLVEKLSEKCNAFETICDQIYFILEQSKRALQLDWQQKKLNLSNNSGNQAKQDTSVASAAAMDEMMGTDLSLSNVDFDMAFDSTTDGMGGSGAADSNELQKDEPMEEDDMEELLQAQRERLDRLRSLLIHRVDAESLTANQGDMGGNDDLLF